MGVQKVNYMMFILWSVGIIGINIYLTVFLSSIKVKLKTFLVSFIADLGLSATAGFITYLLAKTLNFSDVYLVLVAVIIGHLSARVAYKSRLIDLEQINNPDH